MGEYDNDRPENEQPEPLRERPLTELSDKELQQRGYVRVEFHGISLVVSRSSFLLGMLGLPVTIGRYRQGTVDASEVARAFVRTRVAHPRGFTPPPDQFEELLHLVASCSTGPRVPKGSVTAIADTLAEAQKQQDDRIQSGYRSTMDTAMSGFERYQQMMTSIAEAIDSNPVLRALFPRPPQSAGRLPPGMSPEDERRLRKYMEPREHPDVPSSFAVSGGGAQALPNPLGLQGALMGPSEMTRSLSRVVAGLRERSVTVPDSVVRLGDIQDDATPEDLRAATADAAILVRNEGYADAADLLDEASSTLGRPAGESSISDEEDVAFVNRVRAWLTSDFAKDKGADVVIQLIFGLLLLYLSLQFQEAPPPPTPAPTQEVRPAPEAPQPSLEAPDAERRAPDTRPEQPDPPPRTSTANDSAEDAP